MRYLSYLINQIIKNTILIFPENVGSSEGHCFLHVLYLSNPPRKEKVKDTVTSYTAKSEVDKILIEATANENWNIANSKLQVLADAAYQP